MDHPAPPGTDSPSHQRGGLPYLRVAMLLCPDFTLTPMASFVDALRLAADRKDNSRQIYFEWDFLAAGDFPVKASCGLPVNLAANPKRLAAYDCVVVCGGLLRSLGEVDKRTFDDLREADAAGVTLVGLCTGSFVLAEAGLMDGRRCATHFDVLGEFLRRFPNVDGVSTENYIIDGNILTCPGSIVAIEVAAHLISSHGDQARAQKAWNFLLFRPEENRISLKARPYEESLQIASRLTQEAVRAMETRLDTPCTIDDMASFLNTTKSRLHRAFTKDLGLAPAEFWRQIRLQAACELLLGQRRTITEVAYDVGFSDTAHFCSAFRKQFGRSPRTFQRLRGK